jgi:hypothetical protein
VPLRLKDWFERLSLADKSIVLTVVDQQLVQLIYQMYLLCVDIGNGGKFTNSEYPDTRPNQYVKVK